MKIKHMLPGIDASAHELMRFKPDKSQIYGRYEVFYHEDRLYSVRDTLRGTISLVTARNPEEAVRAILPNVVQCGECKHRSHEDSYGRLWCNFHHTDMMIKDFCSYGTPREDVHEGERSSTGRTAEKHNCETCFYLGSDYCCEHPDWMECKRGSLWTAKSEEAHNDNE